jgi:hypothetical protein
MKKLILSAVAVGAMVVGGVARADLIDSVGNTISQIFGVPYDARPPGSVAIGNGIYTDSYGHRYGIDANGNRFALDQYGSYRDQWGRTVYIGANNQPLYVEQNGQLMPYGSNYGSYAMGPSGDADNDGIMNRYDRYPNDARYR